MTENLPATRSDEEAALVVDTVHDLHADHVDPQHQYVQQNIGAALVPLAVIVVLLLAFIAAAWTFFAAPVPA
ncbi:MAG TPA: hypothetical protein VH859_07820 [Candidatus Limnocylindria bacterium]|jgi:hypothetical protein